MPGGRRSPDPTTCESPKCKAAILWTLTPAGKRFPVDAEEVDEGGSIAVELADGVLTARVVKKADRAGKRLRRPHFETCKDLERFRRGRPTHPEDGERGTTWGARFVQESKRAERQRERPQEPRPDSPGNANNPRRSG